MPEIGPHDNKPLDTRDATNSWAGPLPLVLMVVVLVAVILAIVLAVISQTAG